MIEIIVPPNTEELSQGMIVFIYILYALFFILFIWSMLWVYGDAKRLGKQALPVTVFIALIGWPLSLLAWLVFRPVHAPPIKQEEPVECLECNTAIPSGTSACPQCGWTYKA